MTKTISTTTMYAITHERYGEVEVLALRTVPVPAPGPRDVLLRVKAASLNPVDVFRMRGKPRAVRVGDGLRKPRTHIRGTDVAGVVEAVGSEVTAWHVGDEVFGKGRGTLAQYALAREHDLAKVPAGNTFESAAATPLAGLTALHGLRARPVGAGDRVLVIGASGGVGSFAVQMAVAAGATVTGVCSARNTQAVVALGAARAVDYETSSILDTDERFDLILDNVGAQPMLALEKLTTPTGILLANSGFRGPDGGAIARAVKANWRGRVLRKRIGTFFSSTNQEDLRVLANMLADGTIKPLVDTMFDLEHAAEAMRRMGSHHARGKVIVSVS